MVRCLHVLVTRKIVPSACKNDSPVHVTPFTVVGAVEKRHRLLKFAKTLEVEKHGKAVHRGCAVNFVTNSAIHFTVANSTLCINEKELREAERERVSQCINITEASVDPWETQKIVTGFE